MNNKHEEVITLQFVSYAAIPFKAEIYASRLSIDWGDGRVSTYENDHYYSIEYFYPSEGLQHIKISGEQISYLNVSRLSLTELSLDHCPLLEYLDCSVNELGVLDLNHCPALEELRCNSNNLKELILRDKNKINYINLSFNELKELRLTDCSDLKSLHCTNNKLESLELPAATVHDINISYNLLDAARINTVFSQLACPASHEVAVIYYIDNPGTGLCDKLILQRKNWLG